MNIREVLDLTVLGPLLESNWRLTGVPVRLFLMNGEKSAELGKPSLCSRFHEQHPTTRQVCLKAEFLRNIESFTDWNCPFACGNGLREVALPVWLEEKRVGVLFLGPFWLESEELPLEEFRQRARTYGFDEASYVEALRALPVLSHERLERVKAFYADFLNVVSHLGLRNLQWKREAVERNRSQLLAAESEAKYRMLVEGSSDLIYSIGIDGCFTFLSAGVEKFGYTPEEVLGKPMFSFVHPDDRQRIIDKYREGFRRGAHPTTNEFRVITKDGGSRNVEEAGRIICDEQGKPVMVTGILRDVTQRTIAEDALRRGKEIAEAANRAKSSFLAAMSHEIRTPMNAILGFSDLVMQSPLPDDLRSQMEIIRKSGHDLLGIIDDLLDLARIEADQIRFEEKPFSLPQVLREVRQALDVRVREKGLRLVVEAPEQLPDQWLGDALRLKQILHNLIGNAIKFTREGAITLGVQVLPEPSSGESPREIHLTVTDTGIGIPEDKLQTIFEPFTQVDGGYSRRYGGIGLGLAICRRLLEHLGGSIRVESRLGVGSTFTCRIPLTCLGSECPAQVTPMVTPMVATMSRMLRILLAEDEPMSSLLAQTILSRQGHQVTAVETGRDALAAIEGQPFDVVLMDVSMPEMDGLEATRRIRAWENRAVSLEGVAARRSHVPIIALTAHAMKGDEERIRASGVDAYLTKPVVPERLLALVTQLAGSRSDRRSEELRDDPVRDAHS
ncbi:MAG TPA: ATP-binding protein [Candidatus Ozemobacteraceae bacterium]|nr:ATP-binding protein [Candidatus Ozemobacteraceae bacterium]